MSHALLAAAAVLALACVAAGQPNADCCNRLRERTHHPRFCGPPDTGRGWATQCHEWNDHGLHIGNKLLPGGATGAADFLQYADALPGCRGALVEYQCSLWCGRCVSDSASGQWSFISACASSCSKVKQSCRALLDHPVWGKSALFGKCNDTAPELPSEEGAKCVVIRAYGRSDLAVGWWMMGFSAGVMALWVVYTIVYERAVVPYYKRAADRGHVFAYKP
eukprot:m51a1_g11665 hypothetical protein (221) ;mRNA; f:6865-7824